jgi:hypothetical protein
MGVRVRLTNEGEYWVVERMGVMWGAHLHQYMGCQFHTLLLLSFLVDHRPLMPE